MLITMQSLFMGTINPIHRSRSVGDSDTDSRTDQLNLVIMWTRSALDNSPGVIFNPDHVVPLVLTDSCQSQALSGQAQHLMQSHKGQTSLAPTKSPPIHQYFLRGKLRLF